MTTPARHAGIPPLEPLELPLEPVPAASDAGFPGFPGPFPVGRYAGRLRDRLRQFAHVCLIGEAFNVRLSAGPNVYFELRDGDGALPCAMWRTDFEKAGLGPDELRDGVEVVLAGGCDYYAGGPTASPRFSFRASRLRLAGEGDLLARLERLRRQLAGEGLFERQKRLARPALPRTIGVVTAEGSAARRDFLAGLERRGWRGTIVWGYAPVQDRRAAPAIAAAVRELASLAAVDALVITRGGGGIADLWAFCDEALCRTIALLAVPVISAVGHEVDRTLVDDVAAVSCSTPTHAAEAAVAVDCASARRSLGHAAERLDCCGRAAVLERARVLGSRSRAPREHLARQRRHVHQQARELRAASRRRLGSRRDFQRRIAATVVSRKLEAAAGAVAQHGRGLQGRAAGLERAARSGAGRRAETLRAQAVALAAHDPDRALDRGYALLLDRRRQPLERAAAVRRAGSFTIQMADGAVGGRVAEEGSVDER